MSILNNNMRVSKVMLNLGDFPIVREDTILKEALETMDIFHLGIVCVVNDRYELLGIITDGDIRRKLLSVQKPLPAFFVDDAINQAIKKPITISGDVNLSEGVLLMEEYQVWDLPVVDDGKLVGLMHLHPAIKALLQD